MLETLLTTWSSNAAISAAIWLVIGVFVAYLARKPAHQLILSTANNLHSACRLLARAVNALEKRLAARNRDVILSLGQQNLEHSIENEFNRVNAIVTRDLGSYPALHRRITDILEQIEEDYRNASESPPLPPAWLQAIDAIAGIPRSGDATVCKILDNIGDILREAHQETQQAFRESTLERHKCLNRMQPHWRSLQQTLGRVKSTIDGLDQRSATIDDQMKQYEAMRAADDGVARTLSASSMTQFFISALVLVIAIFGGLINFQLIALPMSEMVGASSYIGPMRTSDIAALVIIMVEIAMGLFLLESLRITRMFPIIGSLDDRMRKRMMWITFSILTILATVEASLAYMRDLLALDREALTQSLSGVGVVEAQFRWIPSIGQMVMGFILPFALAFVAIPLESFIHSTRTVVGVLVQGLLQVIALLARLTGDIARQFAQMLVAAYDLFIMLPLGIERLVSSSLSIASQRSEAAKPIADFHFDQEEKSS